MEPPEENKHRNLIVFPAALEHAPEECQEYFRQLRKTATVKFLPEALPTYSVSKDGSVHVFHNRPFNPQSLLHDLLHPNK